MNKKKITIKTEKLEITVDQDQAKKYKALADQGKVKTSVKK